MDDLHLEPGLAAVERHLVTLSTRVEPDPSEYARLRQELLRRHRERRTDITQRAVRSLWPRLSGVKRLTLVAPPALAAVIITFAVLSGMQLTGHQDTQSAQAAQITRALARTVPTVTSWQVRVQHQRGDSAGSVQCASALRRNQHFFVRDGHTYFFDGKNWYQVSAALSGGSAECPLDIRWAFAILPAHLEGNRFLMLPERTLHGRPAEGIQYAVRNGAETIRSTEWVDRTTGLVMRAERLVQRGDRLVERDIADYSYTRA
jgi:hypothetical protein